MINEFRFLFLKSIEKIADFLRLHNYLNNLNINGVATKTTQQIPDSATGAQLLIPDSEST